MTTTEQVRPGPATFAIHTLGCKVNQADSEAIAASLMARGLRPAGDATPDVVVVNTCTVTHLGDRSSRQVISHAQRQAPDALMVATGCYAQVAPAALRAQPGIDLVIGNDQKDRLDAAIMARLEGARPLPMLASDAFPAAENPDRALADIMGRTRAQIKVQDGCDNRCTYCIVPTARGASRSRAIADIIALAQRKAAAGIQEIVLTGVHLGDYHPTPDADLGTLLDALLRETDIPRIRVSSLEPEDFHLDWLDLWRNPRLCRHLHLPLQSGSDAVLRKMARRYSAGRYREIAQCAFAAIPGLALTTDIIVGFPGETEADADRTYALAEELGFAKLHVFRFSARVGTAAARMRAQVADAGKKARAERLLALNSRLSRAFREPYIGRQVEVLWEGKQSFGWEGLTDNYIRVELPVSVAPEGVDIHHQRRLTRITGLSADGVSGELC